MPALRKSLFLTALLFGATPSMAHGNSTPELHCSPDAKISFHMGWIRSGTVELEAVTSVSFPWTGKELQSSGLQLKEKRRLTAGAEDELSSLSDGAAFVSYGSPESGLTLHIDRTLLSRGENDGTIILEQPSAPLIIYHCRSR